MESPSQIDQPITDPTLLPPQPSKPNLVKPILLGLGLFLFVASIAVAAFFYTQNSKILSQVEGLKRMLTPSPTPAETSQDEILTSAPTDWLTYQNTVYNYSVSYPSTLTGTILTADSESSSESPSASTRSWYLSNPQASEPYLNRYLSFELLQADPVQSDQSQKQTVTLDGQTVTKVTQTNGHFDVYIIPVTQGVLEVYVTTASDKTTLANQILSTFKFSDETPSKSTTLNPSPSESWQTFFDSTYPFSFQYPTYATTNAVNNTYLNLIGTTDDQSLIMPILISQNPQNLSPLDQYLQSLGASASADDLKPHLYIKENVPVGDQVGTLIVQDKDYFSQQSTPLTSYLVKLANGSIVNINAALYTGSFDGTHTTIATTSSNQADYQKVLASFRFLK